MTHFHPTRSRTIPSGRSHLAGACTALLAAALALQGCAETPAPVPGARVYAADVQGGAKQCEAPKLTPASGQTADVEVKVRNDGGWCGISVSPNGPGLLTSRPAHGTVLIHRVGDATRIDYTPARGFAGSDSFAVKMLPSDATLRVTVAVTAAS